MGPRETLIFREHVLEILDYVDKTGQPNVTMIKAHVDRKTGTINKIIWDLEKNGILEITKGIEHNASYISTTKKGKEILEHMRAINKILDKNEIEIEEIETSTPPPQRNTTRGGGMVKIYYDQLHQQIEELL